MRSKNLIQIISPTPTCTPLTRDFASFSYAWGDNSSGQIPLPPAHVRRLRPDHSSEPLPPLPALSPVPPPSIFLLPELIFWYCIPSPCCPPPLFFFLFEIVSNSAQTSRSCPFRHARDAAFYPPSPTESNPSTFKTAERAPPLITLAAPPLVTLVPARLAAGAHGSSSNSSVADDAAALAASWLSQTWRTDGANALCIAPVLRIEAGGCEISSPLAFKLLFFTPRSCAGSSTAVLLSPTPMVAIKQQPIPAGVPPCERVHLQLSPRAAAPYEHF